MSYPSQPPPAHAPVPGTPPGFAGQAPPTNTLAIIAFVFVWIFCPVSIVLGHLALGQIRRTGEGGAGLAKAALILGYVFTGLTLLIVGVAVVGALLALSGTAV
jgi:hypothetical protein